MLTTVVALLCHIGTAWCVEEIVTEEATQQECIIGGQQGIEQWMSHNAKYSTGWRLDKYKCIAGHYEVKGRA